MKVLVKLIFAEAETGIVLSEDGSRAGNGNEPYYPEFETKGEAISVMEEYLKRHPFSECSIVEEGKKTETLRSEGFGRYFEEKKNWLKWRVAPKLKRAFMKEPKFEYAERENKTTEQIGGHDSA